MAGAEMAAITPRPVNPDPFALAPARVHEAEGRGRVAFALFQAARHPGPLFWIQPAHRPEVPLPGALPAGVAERLHLLRCRSEADLLWSAEEALRAGPAGLVVAAPERPLSLTAGRRLQLAAEAGRTTGLMLIREGAGSNAAQSRWSCAPVASAGPGEALHRWARIRDKAGATGAWLLRWDGRGPDWQPEPGPAPD